MRLDCCRGVSALRSPLLEQLNKKSPRKQQRRTGSLILFDESLPLTFENGFELDFASQGQLGLQRVETGLSEERPFCVAFVDMRMPPGWDGVETIERLWQANSELQS